MLYFTFDVRAKFRTYDRGALAALERIGIEMEVADGEETRERSRRTRSRGLLAGRLAVKIEICTDSSMRGGGRV